MLFPWKRESILPISLLTVDKLANWRIGELKNIKNIFYILSKNYQIWE